MVQAASSPGSRAPASGGSHSPRAATSAAGVPASRARRASAHARSDTTKAAPSARAGHVTSQFTTPARTPCSASTDQTRRTRTMSPFTGVTPIAAGPSTSRSSNPSLSPKCIGNDATGVPAPSTVCT